MIVPAFDVRQERVLLRLVEAMDLVDEEHRAPARAARAARSAAAMTSLISLMPEVTALNATNSAPATDASSRASVVLPVPGGPQRISEWSAPLLERLPQRPARAEQMRLPDVLVERARPHPLGQRRARQRRASRRLVVVEQRASSRAPRPTRRADAAPRTGRSPPSTATLSESTPARASESTGAASACATHRVGQPAAFVAEQHEQRTGADPRDRAASPPRAIGGRERDLPRASAASSDARQVRARDRHAERAAHRAAQGLPAARVGRRVERDDAGGAERVGAANDARRHCRDPARRPGRGRAARRAVEHARQVGAAPTRPMRDDAAGRAHRAGGVEHAVGAVEDRRRPRARRARQQPRRACRRVSSAFDRHAGVEAPRRQMLAVEQHRVVCPSPRGRHRGQRVTNGC